MDVTAYGIDLYKKYALAELLKELCEKIDPEKGIIPPGSFIPLFERNGFIINVDEYIWEDVCRKMALWRDKGYQIVPVSVNVSRLHIFDPNFTTKIKNLVAKNQDLMYVFLSEQKILQEINLCKNV